jgi:predicted kinase
MARALILVNGLPGAGKSTLAVKLAALLGCPVLSKDAVKESFADLTGEMVPGSDLGAIAMESVWSLAAAVEDGAVIENFWVASRDHDFAREGVERSGAARVVEVWCDAPADLIRARFEGRPRPSVHSAWDESWISATPLEIWPVVRVDTSKSVDMDALLPELAAHLIG